MKARPILFSAPMVRAILAGTKTVTRRTCKPQPEPDEKYGGHHWPSNLCRSMVEVRDMGGLGPYGGAGDRLWVKETWRSASNLDAMSPTQIGERSIDAGYHKPWAPLRYEADQHERDWQMLPSFGGAWGKTRVSIHMPRWASRITLDVVSVRVERLHDITEEDAKAEGVSIPDAATAKQDTLDAHGMTPHRAAFACLWEQINGAGSWAANHWVWRVAFQRAGAR